MADVTLLPCPLCSHALDEAGACQWCARCDATMAAWNEYSRPALTPKQAAADEMAKALALVYEEGMKSEAIDCGDHCHSGCMWCAVRDALAKAGQP